MVNDTSQWKSKPEQQQRQEEEKKLSPFTKRILIVDDDPDITFTFKKAFEEANRISGNKSSFHVNTYNDPIVALSEFKPDFYDLKTTVQKEVGPNRTQYTFATNGTMNGNIEVTNTGEYVSISLGNNLLYEQGKGVIKTKDGSETANYTFIDVVNSTDFQGASTYSTKSTGKLAFLNNILGIYKIEQDESGNYAGTHWHWK